ncbi:MAG: tetratricopeptide repeat protein [Novosphingobium sp.]|uniref:tetratricopeptide repeat protein n=1 Tax=Novosphingobium sp. TaxID=1874826 RepID=UPI0032B89C55
MASEPPKNPPAPSKSAERDAAQQDGFLREVDEALREEQMVDAVKRWAKPVGAAIVIGLVAMGGYMVWDNSKKQAAGEISEKVILALDKVDAGQLDGAAKDLSALSGQGSDGNRAVVAMSLAAIAQEQGKSEEAAKKFAAIAADTSMPKVFRDLATIREVSIRYDAMKPEDVIAKLKPLAVPGNAFFGSAGELLGMAYLDAGKPELAGPLFAQIGNDKNVPESLRKRTRQIASGLGFDGGDDVPSDSPGDPSGAAKDAAAATAKQ